MTPLLWFGISIFAIGILFAILVFYFVIIKYDDSEYQNYIKNKNGSKTDS